MKRLNLTRTAALVAGAALVAACVIDPPAEPPVATTTTSAVTTSTGATTTAPTTTVPVPSVFATGCHDSTDPAVRDLEYNGIPNSAHNLLLWYSFDGSCTVDPGYQPTMVFATGPGSAGWICASFGLSYYQYAKPAISVFNGVDFPYDAYICVDLVNP